MAQLYIEPEHVLAGLSNADRESLSTLIALYEETYLQKLVVDMLKDAGSWVAKKIKDKLVSESDENSELKKEERKKAFERRLAEKSKSLQGEQIATESLRLRLWMHLRNGLGLPADLAFFRVESHELTNDIAKRTQEIFAKQLDDEDARKLKFFSKEYWKEYAKVRLNPFTHKTVNDPTFSDVIKLNTLSIIAAAAERGTLPGELQAELTRKVGDLVDGLNEGDRRQLLSQFETEEVTESSAMKILLGARGLFSLGLGKELAGLAAYILVANSSALVPLLGGSALIGTTTVLANPLFVVPVMLLGSVFMARNMKKRVREAFGIAVCTVLVLRAISEQRIGIEPILKVFRNLPSHLPEDIRQTCNEMIRNKLAEQQAPPESSGKGTLKKAARLFGRWAKDGFASDDYPDALEYIERYNSIKASGESRLMEKAEAKVEATFRANRLDSKLREIDSLLDQLAGGQKKPRSDEVDSPADPLDTVRDAAALDEEAFAGEDTQPDPPADIIPEPDPTSLDPDRGLSDDELSESPTRDLKAVPRAAAAAEAAASRADHKRTVLSKPSPELLSLDGDGRDGVCADHRVTIQGKPFTDPGDSEDE